MSNPLDAKDNPYVQYSSASASPNGKYKMWEALDRCGKTFEDCSRMIEAVADSLWNHLKLGSSVTDTAMTRLHLGTKLLTKGGIRNYGSSQWYDIVHFEHKLSWVCFGLPQ
ncbi:GEM-like protein 2, partial [Cucurbita maxima]|uniref:GEM-like protein 2 n=1 Tax=Cucurbita maxima TaxID=3661 RepID=A0A6J1HQK3_CUCMA